MKLSDYKGEAALDLLADILDPATEILADSRIKDAVRGDASKMEIIKLMLRGHKKSIIQILAIIDGEDPKKYEVNVLTLPIKLIELLNDSDFLQLFGSQAQKVDGVSSGPATETTEETAEK